MKAIQGKQESAPVEDELLDGWEGGARSSRPEVVLYGDGSCSGNPGPGGWAAILVSPGSGREVVLSGGDPATTNNRMELTAVLEGLRRLKRPSKVRVVTDSRYIVDGMTGWIHGWKSNGWRTAARKPVKNRDLWEELDRLSAIHRVEWEWTEGHAGHAENERCDELAVEETRKAADGR